MTSTRTSATGYGPGLPASLLLLLLLLALAVRPLSADGYLSGALTPEQVAAGLGDPGSPLIVDVRDPAEFAIAHIPGAVNIPLAEVGQRLAQFRHPDGVLVYCLNGTRTRRAEQVLFEHDITRVYHLEGAFNAWIQGGFPHEKGGVPDRRSW